MNMASLKKSDRENNLWSRLKESDRPNLRKMSKQDVRRLLTIYDDLMYDFFVDAHEHGLDSVGLGAAGKVKIVVRPPSPYFDVHKKEYSQSGYTPLYYFKPTEKLREEGKKVLRERLAREERE